MSPIRKRQRSIREFVRAKEMEGSSARREICAARGRVIDARDRARCRRPAGARGKWETIFINDFPASSVVGCFPGFPGLTLPPSPPHHHRHPSSRGRTERQAGRVGEARPSALQRAPLVLLLLVQGKSFIHREIHRERGKRGVAR